LQIRQNDRLAVSKLVTSLTRGTVRSPLAQCLLIRYTSQVCNCSIILFTGGVTSFCHLYQVFSVQVIRESATNTQTGDRPFYDFLEGCLRHKAEMVIFEAARAITELNGVSSRELTPAITVLQLFLSSSKPVLRFAAVRTLNKVNCFSVLLQVFLQHFSSIMLLLYFIFVWKKIKIIDLPLWEGVALPCVVFCHKLYSIHKRCLKFHSDINRLEDIGSCYLKISIVFFPFL
jgi:hypothetical protein